jgi:hypothetical protein
MHPLNQLLSLLLALWDRVISLAGRGSSTETLVDAASAFSEEALEEKHDLGGDRSNRNRITGKLFQLHRCLRAHCISHQPCKPDGRETLSYRFSILSHGVAPAVEHEPTIVGKQLSVSILFALLPSDTFPFYTLELPGSANLQKPSDSDDGYLGAPPLFFQSPHPCFYFHFCSSRFASNTTELPNDDRYG